MWQCGHSFEIEKPLSPNNGKAPGRLYKGNVRKK
jgi:hypothetical protein